MTEEQPRERWSAPQEWPDEATSVQETAQAAAIPEQPVSPPPTAAPAAAGDGLYAPESAIAPHPDIDAGGRPPLFQHYEAPRPPERIPNFGHLLILGGILLVGILLTGLAVRLGLHQHLFGISSTQEAISDIHYTLGSEAILYLFTLAGAYFLFPVLWQKSFFAGLQWNVGTAIRLRYRLFSAAIACLFLAVVSSFLVPEPKNAPIDRIFRAPGAAWLLFVFGVTFAPFFEEMFFRGFLLPALCTAVDWFGEKIAHQPRLPLEPNGHPEWSMTAIVVGSIATSIPFAAMHAAQTGYSIGPFVLLCGVSLVLCAIRLSTKSLASSVLVHASYNFVLFSIMLAGTDWFRHVDKM